MKYITTYLSVPLVALFVSQAQSQYIEIRYEVTTRDHGFYRTGRSVLIFDTSVAPEVDKDGAQTYYAIAGEYYYDVPSRRETPFKVLDEEENVFEYGWLRYGPGSQSLVVYTGPTAGRVMFIILEEVTADFFEGMDSLPDAPESYALTEDYNSQSISGTFSTGGTASWNSKEGYQNGGVTYGARLVTELEPEACSPADINGDGIVDFFDVSEFIQIFLAGCP